MQPAEYDILIIGGALAGASMGLLIKRELPEARVLIVERSLEFDFKVGESTSEIGGCFLSRILRLSSWLSREHITKNGLRFWFNAGDNKDLSRCAEAGPKLQVRLPAWQLDRSTLDPHVLELAVAAGCELWRPATVRNIVTGGLGNNSADVTGADGTTTRVRARWMIDASGRAAVVARQHGTLQNLEDHPTNSIWARFSNVADLDAHDLVARHPCLAKRVWSQRATATNHLTGRGWWAWIIPLKGGEVSVGVTWDRRLFTPPTEGTVPDRLRAHLMTHPIGEYLLREAKPVDGDAYQYKQLAYFSTEVAGDGWAAVGDAAGFMDPLYSHGIDFIGNTVWAVSRIVIRSLRGEDTRACTSAYNAGYRDSYKRWFDALYRDKYEYIGDAELMYAAVLLDVGFYFFWPVRLTYKNHSEELIHLPYAGKPGGVVAAFMAFYNRRLVHLGRERARLGMYGRHNLDHQFIFRESFHPSRKVFGLIADGMKTWLKCEITTWWRGLGGSGKPAMAAPAPATAAPASDPSPL